MCQRFHLFKVGARCPQRAATDDDVLEISRLGSTRSARWGQRAPARPTLNTLDARTSALARLLLRIIHHAQGQHERHCRRKLEVAQRQIHWLKPRSFGRPRTQTAIHGPPRTPSFDVEITRIPPGATPYPYHSHSAQWEFYHVISGKGIVRDQQGTTPIETGDAFIFEPGQPHQITNNGTEDLVIYTIADNPIGETAHYPDSKKWLVRSPERKIVRGEGLDYYEGEE